MEPFPRLETPRLVLRALAEADVPCIVALASDHAVARNTLNMPHPYHPDDAHNWLRVTRKAHRQGEDVTFAVELKATGEFIGGIGLKIEPRFDRAEAGYWLGVPYWNQGLMTEALAAVLRYGFEGLGLNKILATHTTQNPGSGAVMRKNGMVQEGELVAHVKRDGQYYDLAQYRLTRHEYAQRAG
ncbi:GNAT family N-acetyltransferase [Hymenobacter caeli]|uniref:RimJ/RimL family protein N-acetyltransferase n=1 Tax=Hymenobacter caeli TaxID=2735894 RepID=A0ABX2FVQ6_9BACT|nr:GNAT family N-acetyltransferase [Hymenobacter caeli]NRT21295.1 RimJ/RimL family protein N-acetyltransferase [Hymenobacter caeli]